MKNYVSNFWSKMKSRNRTSPQGLYKMDTEKTNKRTAINSQIIPSSKLMSSEEYSVLFDSGELGIIKRNSLDFLAFEPWNVEAITRLVDITSGQERRLYLLDLLKVDPSNSEALYSLIDLDRDFFMGDSKSSLEALTRRLDLTISLLDNAIVSYSQQVFTELTEKAYRIDPYRSRDFALALFRTISRNFPHFSLEYFRSLRRNIIDERLLKSALTTSKSEERHFLSLDLIPGIQSEEEREYEKMVALDDISTVIFEGSEGDLEKLLTDCKGIDLSEKFSSCLQKLANFSQPIGKFIAANQQISSNNDIVKRMKIELREFHANGRLFDFSNIAFGNFEEDIVKLPLYAIDHRIHHQLAICDSPLIFKNSISPFYDNPKISDKRRNQIIVSSLNCLRGISIADAMDFIDAKKIEENPDERVIRQVAKTLESNGDLPRALNVLRDCSQTSSIKMTERFTKLAMWIENGYALDVNLTDQEDYSPSPKKIMYCVHSSLPFVNSGYTIRTEGVVSSLKNKGFEVSVFSRWGYPEDRIDYTGEDIFSNKYTHSNIEYVIDPHRGGITEYKNDDYINRAAESLYKSALIYRPSLIYSASDHTIGLASAIVAKKLSLPFVYEMRGLWALSRAANNPDFLKSSKFKLMMRLEKQTAQMADKLFVISPQLKEEVVSWGLDPAKIEIIPNGISEHEINQKSEDSFTRETELTIGYFGAIVEYEGLDILVDAAQRMNRNLGNSNTRYLVVGDGADRIRIEGKVKQKGLARQFTFSGKVPLEEVDEYYSKVDIVVIPRKSHSVTEIIPALKPITAMGKGKIVICSDVGPSKELITDGENGFLFAKDDSDSLADVLEMVSRNTTLLEVGRRAKKWAETHRKWDIVMEAAKKTCARLMLELICDSSNPDTSSAIDLIRIIFGEREGSSHGTQSEFDLILPRLKKERDRRNLFLAFLRELGDLDPLEGLKFGKDNLERFGDRRSVRTLITYANRVGDLENSKDLLARFSQDLDTNFTISQKSRIEAYDKIDSKRRQVLTKEPFWYTFDLDEFGIGKRLEITGRADIEKGDEVKSALGRFEFFDMDDQSIEEQPGFLYRSKSVGFYHYLAPQEGVFKLPFLPPEGATKFRVGFQIWEKDAVVSIHPRINVGISSSQQMSGRLSEFANSARQSYGSDLIFMFSGTTYMNEVRANRPIRLTRVMLERGNRVIFNYHRSNIREDIPPTNNENLFQIPIDITTELIEDICEMDFGKCRKVFMISYPHPIIPKVLHRFKQNGWVVIYDARDDWEEFSKVGQARWYRGWAEKYIVNNSDKSTAVSWPLAKKLSKYCDNEVEVVPNALSPKFKSKDFVKSPERRNLVGYFGHLTDSWFDWQSLISIAEDLHDFYFEIIGHSEPKDLQLPANISILGPKNHPEINKIAARWDAAIIPFKTGPLSDAVDPIKIYEYLALGIPTISFTMPQIDSYPLTRTYANIEGFKDGLKWAVNLEVDAGEIDAWLEENTWEKRVECYEKWYDIR